MNRTLLEFAEARECEITEILGQNAISIHNYNPMDAMQKPMLKEQNYLIIMGLNETLK